MVDMLFKLGRILVAIGSAIGLIVGIGVQLLVLGLSLSLSAERQAEVWVTIGLCVAFFGTTLVTSTLNLPLGLLSLLGLVAIISGGAFILRINAVIGLSDKPKLALALSAFLAIWFAILCHRLNTGSKSDDE